MVLSHRARVAAPVVGTETPPGRGYAGELVERVLAKEGIQRESFHLSDLPKLSSEGTYRALLGLFPLSLFPGGKPVVQDGRVTFHFCLEKGEYATVLLREFLKDPSSPRSID